MALGIDFVGTNLGSGTKTYNLNFCNFLENENLKEKVYIFLTKNYYNEVIKKKNKNIVYIIKPEFYSIIIIRVLWMQFFLPFELKRLKIKKFFSPMNFGPIFLKFFKIRFFLALHSNLPWVLFNMMPGNYIRNILMKYLIERSINACEKLIVDSRFAKKEISNLLKLDVSKVYSIYLGIDERYLRENKSKEKDIKSFDYNDYFISVLSCVKYHNILNLLKVYKVLKKENNFNLKFVLVLQVLDREYFKEIKNFVKDNFKNSEVIFLKNLENIYLKKLYRNAKFYIFSSYCEVFGLTSLEAMSQGCPVLISNRSALPEVNGSAALYFDPDNLDEIKSSILDISQNDNLRSNLINIGNKHYAKYDWRVTVKETMKILEI